MKRSELGVDYTGGWPHGVDECVWRLPPGAVMASPFGYDETRTQLSAHVSALRNTPPPFMAYSAGGAVPFARCSGDRAGPARGAESGMRANPPYLRTTVRIMIGDFYEPCCTELGKRNKLLLVFPDAIKYYCLWLLAIPRCNKLLLLMAAGLETCKCRLTKVYI
jgi:hypothetical protein